MRAVLAWGALALFATSFVFVELNHVRKNFNAKAWPQVESTVLNSSPKRGCGKGTSYSPLVRYQYTINEKQYVSEILAHSTFDCGGFEEMKARTDPFAPGQKVQAHVDPKDPRNAVLTAGVISSDSTYGIALFGLLGLGCAYFARQGWRGAA